MQKMSEKEVLKLTDRLRDLANDTEVDMFCVASLNAYFEESANSIQTLFEEIQRYRAIGTVEECRADKDFLEFLYDHILPNEMEQYLSMYRTKDKIKVNGYADQSGLMPAT